MNFFFRILPIEDEKQYSEEINNDPIFFLFDYIHGFLSLIFFITGLMIFFFVYKILFVLKSSLNTCYLAAGGTMCARIFLNPLILIASVGLFCFIFLSVFYNIVN
jgi:hypothetical protein